MAVEKYIATGTKFVHALLYKGISNTLIKCNVNVEVYSLKSPWIQQTLHFR